MGGMWIMDLFRRSRFLAAAVTSALLLSVVAFAAAQSTASQRDPDAELRATLTEFYTEFETAYAPFARIGPAGMMDLAAAGRRSIPLLTSQELAALRDGLPPSLWRSWKTTVIPALRRAHRIAPALEGALLASSDPLAPSAALMAHSCPQLILDNTAVTPQLFTDGLLAARSVELGLQIAYNAGSNDPTGVAGGALSAPLGIAMGVRFALEQIQLKNDVCESGDHAATVHDKVDEKVSTRASQKSVDDLSKLLTGMLDELKALINGRADRQEALTNTRADRQENLTNTRSDRIEALVNKRTDYIDTYEANVVAHRQIDLQVLQIERGRLLVIASEAGQALRVNVTSLKVSDLKKGPVSFQEVSPAHVRQDAPGVLEITLDMRGPAKDADAYLISVAHAHGQVTPIGSVTHTGVTIFRRDTD